MDPMTILQLALKYAPLIKETIDVSSSNSDLTAKIKQVAAPLVPFLEQMGAKMFPKAAQALHLVGAVVSSFDPNLTKWLQGGLNKIVSPSPNLVVDGIYGPRTTAAVEAAQKQLNLTIDGIAGSVTQTAIQNALAKLAG